MKKKNSEHFRTKFKYTIENPFFTFFLNRPKSKKIRFKKLYRTYEKTAIRFDLINPNPFKQNKPKCFFYLKHKDKIACPIYF